MLRRAAPWALALTLGCASGVSLRREGESIQVQLDNARQAGAYRCSPKALAMAESQLEFLQGELTQGNSTRAAEHRDLAQSNLAKVLEDMKTCPPLVADRDGDGVADDVDKCPDVPGPVANQGCPDRDGDGIHDGIDQCPDAPEDKDGVEDEDGCPENEDRDGDSLIDTEDDCPTVPGPIATRGCPDTDGDGLLDKDDDCPKIPGPKENKGCPYGDRDGDGIVDDKDQCPDAPEDKDGFEDEDGCPDPDNDADGILDVDDRCPLQPENMNGHLDADGCPDVKLELVEVRRETGKIEIKQKVFFDTGKARIQPRSYELLNQVAEVLKTYTTMRVMVEGHTDSVGSSGMNLKLSQRRADAVREYVIGQGIDPDRLSAVGFGEEKPIDSNQTKQGRERNRRVEFTITGE
ncbi:MAG: OmpA family protein [Myxococcales bacterium]|nr:OmpA family protein [Myxococcales bacterium]MCB9647479.1 OmpA family protein [Deltaproteobacteria bacterium]